MAFGLRLFDHRGSIVGLANHKTLIRKDKADVPSDDDGAPFRTTYGKISSVVIVFRDIADRRKRMTLSPVARRSN